LTGKAGYAVFIILVESR